MERRCLLGTLGSVMTVTIAGCQTNNEETTTDPQQKTDYRLTHVAVTNEDTTAQSVDIVVLREETVVYWTTVDLEPESGWLTDATAFDLPEDGDGAAEWTIHARLAGRNDGESISSEGLIGRNGCLYPAVIVDKNGSLWFGERFTDDECP